MVEIACVVEAHDALGESCIWCPQTRKIWWVDILGPSLQSFDAASRHHAVYPLPARNCGCVALRASGGLILALNNGLHAFDPASGRLEFLLHVEPDEPHNRYNDGRCDRRGRLWIGTMDADLRRSSGSLYRIDPDRTVERLFGGITVPNSTAFSPDDHRFYFADTPRHVIWVFDFDLDAGAISNRRVFADLRARSAMPDGSCVDSEGCLWNAEYGGHRLTRYAPDGRVIQTIDLPVTNPTCCCFGGDKLDTVFVTSAAPSPRANQPAPLPIEGGLLAVNVGVCGLPENAYGG